MKEFIEVYKQHKDEIENFLIETIDNLGEIQKFELTKDNVSITAPYISSATGNSCTTLVKIEGDNMIFLDFQLVKLLERLGLIEMNMQFNSFTKLFYSITGFSMVMLSI